jgi:hypothetical protein
LIRIEPIGRASGKRVFDNPLGRPVYGMLMGPSRVAARLPHLSKHGLLSQKEKPPSGGLSNLVSRSGWFGKPV